MITSYDDMNIDTFMEVKDILEDESIGEFEKKARLLSILNEVSYDDILETSIDKVPEMIKGLEFLKEEPKKKVPPPTIKLNDKIYNIQYDIKNISVSQYIDFQTFIKDYEKYMVELASIVVIPVGKKYNEGYDITEVQDDIREYMSITQLSNICFFFVKTFNALMESLTHYSIRGLKKMMRKEKDRVKKIKLGRVIVQMKQLMEQTRLNG